MEQALLEGAALYDGFITAVVRAGIYRPASLALAKQELLNRITDEDIDEEEITIVEAFIAYLDRMIADRAKREASQTTVPPYKRSLTL